MKIFKYKFTKLLITFIYLGLALSVAAAALNTYFLIADGISQNANPIYPILQYSLTYLVAVLLFIILLSLLISTYYAIDGTTFKTSFGIIKSKYDIEKIKSIVLDRTTKKLTVYFDEQTFIVIVVKVEWYDEFITSILKVNPDIEYTINSKEEPDIK